MEQTLNDLMQFDHVIRVGENGMITDDVDTSERENWAPEIYVETDKDGQIVVGGERDMIASAFADGWVISGGWTTKMGGGAIMRASEYIGGALEQHIRETPGLWVAVVVETLDDSEECAGWVVAMRDEVS